MKPYAGRLLWVLVVGALSLFPALSNGSGAAGAQTTRGATVTGLGGTVLSNAAAGACPATTTLTLNCQYAPVSKYLDISPASSGDLSHPYVKGKVVVVVTDNHSQYPMVHEILPPRTINDSWDFYYPAPELHPKHPSDVGTIVWEDCTPNPVGSYTNGRTGYEIDCIVTVIDKAANLIVGQKTFTVPPPGDISPGDPYGIDTEPTQEIGDYIAALPRESLSGTPLPPTTKPTGLGLPWTQQRTPPGVESATLSAVTFTDASHGWVVGGAQGAGTILATTDGGATWSVQTPTGASVAGLSAVAFKGPTHGWAVGGQGTILATTDGGATWNAQNSGTSIASLAGVAFTDATHGWAVGDHGTIVATTDGGATWNAQNSGSSTASLAGVAFVDASHGWAVGDQGTILATTDGGATWKQEKSGTSTASLAGVAFVDANRGWAVGDHGTILATTDGGAHWKHQKSSTSEALFGVTFVDATHGWAVGGVVNSTMLATTDGGAHWKHQKSSTSEALYGVTFVDTTHGWAVGDQGVVVVTTNGGASSHK